MTAYEHACERAYAQFIQIVQHVLPERIRGLYFENEFMKIITLNKNLITEAEKTCTVTEETGHSIYGGNIFANVPDAVKRKWEKQARAYAYKILLPADALLDALKSPYYYGEHEIAEEFEVTVDFLRDAVEYYKTTGDIPSYNDWDENNDYDWGA